MRASGVVMLGVARELMARRVSACRRHGTTMLKAVTRTEVERKEEVTMTTKRRAVARLMLMVGIV